MWNDPKHDAEGTADGAEGLQGEEKRTVTDMQVGDKNLIFKSLNACYFSSLMVWLGYNRTKVVHYSALDLIYMYYHSRTIPLP